MSIQRMTRIALLSAILYVSKVVLEFLPNIELVSLLVIEIFLHTIKTRNINAIIRLLIFTAFKGS